MTMYYEVESVRQATTHLFITLICDTKEVGSWDERSLIKTNTAQVWVVCIIL